MALSENKGLFLRMLFVKLGSILAAGATNRIRTDAKSLEDSHATANIMVAFCKFSMAVRERFELSVAL